VSTKPFAIRNTPRAKITEYLLNENHPVGGGKAAFFFRFGFSAERWHVLAAALDDHPIRNPVENETVTAFGTKHLVRCASNSGWSKSLHRHRLDHGGWDFEARDSLSRRQDRARS